MNGFKVSPRSRRHQNLGAGGNKRFARQDHPTLGLQQVEDAGVQRLGQPMQDQQRRVLQAALDLTDVRSIDFGLEGKLLLGKVSRSTKAQQICCHRPLHVLELPIHDGRLASMGP